MQRFSSLILWNLKDQRELFFQKLIVLDIGTVDQGNHVQ